MQTSIALDAHGAIPEEERALPGRRETYAELVRRLSHQSVLKHFDAYADIDWDGDDFRIDPADPRWELGPEDSLGETAWYRAQPPDIRARIGLHLVATFMKTGLQFESILKRGLLDFAFDLPNGSPEYRYVYHEVIEEAQHALMFQEFVNRTGFDIPGLGGLDRFLSRTVIRLARIFPELFFFFVLGGEDPIDYVQRKMLSEDENLHPLAEQALPDRRMLAVHRSQTVQTISALASQRLFDEVPARHPRDHGAADDAAVGTDRPPVPHPRGRRRRGLPEEPPAPGEDPRGPGQGPRALPGARSPHARIDTRVADARHLERVARRLTRGTHERRRRHAHEPERPGHALGGALDRRR